MAPSIEFEIFPVKRWEDHPVQMYITSLQGTVKLQLTEMAVFTLLKPRSVITDA